MLLIFFTDCTDIALEGWLQSFLSRKNAPSLTGATSGIGTVQLPLIGEAESTTFREDGMYDHIIV